MAWVVGIDVGGTFTDFFALNDANGEMRVYKRPSTPENPAAAIVAGMREFCAEADIAPAGIERISHGTTVATNALIQRRGGKVSLITTAGFRDLLEIGRQTRPHLFSLQIDNPDPLVDRERRFEVSERIGATGEVRTALCPSSLERAVEQVRQSGAEACAVTFLFSFLNPAHERAAGDALAKLGLFTSISSEVQPEFREYERFSTTVLNAYLQPVMDAYLTQVGSELKAQFPNAPVGIYQSSGGLMSVERARALPVRTALSGPAAGAIGAVHVSREAARAAVITFDMGGTSTDVCLIRDHTVSVSHDRDVAGFPIRLPMVDIATIGAGGGSIAWFDRDGLLKVGPISAGAVPGPACYGRGGDKPTVSDANCILGRLAPGGLIGGRMSLDLAAARRAFQPIADQLGGTLEEAARGVLGIVTANMVGAIRSVSVERGHDPAGFALMPFGGAGPLHAAEVARSLRMTQIVVPPNPGILCALGLLVSDLKEDFVRTVRADVSDGGLGKVAEALGDLLESANSWAANEGFDPADRRDKLVLEMRYVGQNFELPVAVSETAGGFPPPVPDAASVNRAFFAAHEQAYGFHNADAPTEVVNVRLTSACATRPLRSRSIGRDKALGEPVARQTVFFSDEPIVDTPIYDRSTFAPGLTFTGPAIVSQFDSTTVVFPDDRVSIDEALNMHIEVAP